MPECQYNEQCDRDATHHIRNREGPDKDVCTEHKNTIMIHEVSAYSDDNPVAELLD